MYVYGGVCVRVMRCLYVESKAEDCVRVLCMSGGLGIGDKSELVNLAFCSVVGSVTVMF